MGKLKDKFDNFVKSKAFPIYWAIALCTAGSLYLVLAPKKPKEFDYRSGEIRIEDRMYLE